MPQTMQIDVFDQGHFPVGSAVRVHMRNRFFDAIILRYEEYFTQMVIATTGVVSTSLSVGVVCTEGNQLKLNVHELNDEYTLERLVPESSEESDLDYKTLMTEHGGSPDDDVPVLSIWDTVTIRVRVDSNGRNPRYEAATKAGVVVHGYPLPPTEITHLDLDNLVATDELSVEYPIVLSPFSA